MTNPSFRSLARRVFENVHEFEAKHFLNWSTARDRVLELARDHRKGEDIPREVIAKLKGMEHWGQFFCCLAGHRLFSCTPEVEHFLLLWDEISGFDVDGLLDVGDLSSLEARINEELTARYALGRNLKSNEPFAEGLPGDEHVHFGQLADLGLLWHQHLAEEQCRWQRYAPKLDRGRAFAERADQLAGSPGRGFCTSSHEQEYLPRQVGTWASCMSQARLLFAYFRKHERTILLDQDNEDVIRFLDEVLRANTPTIDAQGVESDWFGDREQAHDALLAEVWGDLTLGQSITIERALVAGLGREARLAHAFASAYLCLKSAAMHAVCGNAVRCFHSFGQALSVLDHIYERKPAIFTDAERFIEVSRRHVHEGSAPPRRLLYRANRATMGIGKADRFRLHAEHWKTAGKISENGCANLVLSFQREDFVRDTSDFHDIEKLVLTKIADWEHNLPCKIVGLDLCGPEAQDPASQSSEHDKLASTSMLFDPIDKLLDFRDKLSDIAGRHILTSFHVGEHFVDWELGLLSTLALLTDPRFMPRVDRISHALILGMQREEGEKAPPITQSERDSATTRVRRNCEGNANGVFSNADLELIKRALDALVEGHPEDLNDVHRLLREKVEAGVVTVEVCPYSNRMIRKLAPRNHPWRSALSTGSILVGTDNPSLTQTLPWMEYAALKFANRSYTAT